MKVEIYWIGEVARGRLAVMPRPRGGDWLAGEIASLRADGVDVLVSFLGRAEARELELEGEGEACAREGIAFLHQPIEDRSTPEDRDDAVALFASLLAHLEAGRGVAVHCRMGIGRASLAAAAVMVLAGLSADEAFRRIEAARHCRVPDAAEQRRWVEELARARPPRLRAFRPEDAPAVRDIVASVLASFGLGMDTTTDEDLADIGASYVAGSFYVLDQGGRVVGCGGVRVEGERAEVRKMYFLPEARGRGLGRRLLETLLGDARRLGARTACLETNAVLADAIALYRRNGFVEAPPPRRVACRCDVYMERPLGLA